MELYIELLKQILAAVFALSATVGTLQADVNALKSKAGDAVFGAVSVLSSPLEVNGSQIYSERKTVRTASSSLASFKSPSASSTLQAVQCNIVAGNTYANTYVIGWANNPYATTTQIARFDVPAAHQAFTLVGTSTNLTQDFGIATLGVVPPNTYINFKLGTSTVITNINIAPIGTCTAQFLI